MSAHAGRGVRPRRGRRHHLRRARHGRRRPGLRGGRSQVSDVPGRRWPATGPASAGTAAAGEWVRLTDGKGRRHNICLEPGKSFHTNRGGHLPRRHHRPRRGLHADLDLRRRVPRLPAAAQRVRGLDAARRCRGLPQGRRPDRRDGRHLPGRARRRGRRRLRRADLLAAARRRPDRPRLVLRAPRGVRRRRPPQRHPVLRRPEASHPAWTLTVGDLVESPARRRGARQRRPGRARHARALGVRRRRRRRARAGRHRGGVRRDHHPARPDRRDPARPRRVHRAPALGDPGPRLARRGARRTTRPHDERPHRVPRHRPTDGPGQRGAGEEASSRARRLRSRLRRARVRPACRRGRGPGHRCTQPEASETRL